MSVGFYRVGDSRSIYIYTDYISERTTGHGVLIGTLGVVGCTISNGLRLAGNAGNVDILYSSASGGNFTLLNTGASGSVSICNSTAANTITIGNSTGPTTTSMYGTLKAYSGMSFITPNSSTTAAIQMGYSNTNGAGQFQIVNLAVNSNGASSNFYPSMLGVGVGYSRTTETSEPASPWTIYSDGTNYGGFMQLQSMLGMAMYHVPQTAGTVNQNINYTTLGSYQIASFSSTGVTLNGTGTPLLINNPAVANSVAISILRTSSTTSYNSEIRMSANVSAAQWYFGMDYLEAKNPDFYFWSSYVGGGPVLALNRNVIANSYPSFGVSTAHNALDDGTGLMYLAAPGTQISNYSSTNTTGTVSTGGVSSTTVTGTSTGFTSAMLGGLLVVSGAAGSPGLIVAVTNGTILTLSAAMTITAGSSFTIYYGGSSQLTIHNTQAYTSPGNYFSEGIRLSSYYKSRTHGWSSIYETIWWEDGGGNDLSMMVFQNQGGSGTVTQVANITDFGLTLMTTSNQLVFGGTGFIVGTNPITYESVQTTITVPTPASGARTYTIPDAGANANICMDHGNYTIAGNWTFTSSLTVTGLTDTALVATNGSDALQSVTLSNANGCNFSFTGSTLTCTMTQNLTTSGSPTFAGLTLSGLTDTALVATNGSDVLQSVTLSNANGCNFSFTGSTLTCTMTQNLTTSGSPTFAGLTLSGLSTGIVHSSSLGVLSSSLVSLTSDITGILPPANGGTGINNGSNTITIAGNHTLSGAYTSTFTFTANTSVIFPTSGTLVNTTVTTLSDLASVSTITTGTWQATPIAISYLGINAGSGISINGSGLITANGANLVAGTNIGLSGNTVSVISDPTFSGNVTCNATLTSTAGQVIYGQYIYGISSVLTVSSGANSGTVYLGTAFTTELVKTLHNTWTMDMEMQNLSLKAVVAQVLHLFSTLPVARLRHTYILIMMVHKRLT